MSDHDFLFALDLSDGVDVDQLLQEVAAAVLQYVGCDAATSEAAVTEIRAAVAVEPAAAVQHFAARFRAHGGTLQIGITFANGHSWETARALPARS